METKQQIFVSTDIESNGPIPGEYSMLSFGSVALKIAEPHIIDTFYVNLETIKDAKEDKDTMDWWKQERNIEAYKKTRVNMKTPELAMKLYYDWLIKLPGDPVFVSYPAGFDFTFIYWYLMKFVGKSPFSFSAIDIKTYAMAMLKKPYKQCTKRNMPNRWHDATFPHTHNALDDAFEQGFLFLTMLKENEKNK